MSHPARLGAADPGIEHPGDRKPDRRAAGWTSAQLLVVTAAEGAGLAAAELAERPGCPGALYRAELLADALAGVAALAGELAEIERGRVIDESVLEVVRAEAYAQGVADCKAARCRLQSVPVPG